MYRFQVVCETAWGEELFLVGASEELGAWDVNRAIPLKPNPYPCWKSSALKLSGGSHMEYKYFKRTSHGLSWEQGANRWVPVEDDAVVTVCDSGFGIQQPQPFALNDSDDRPISKAASPGKMRVVIIGSSVAEGFNAWRKRGWAYLLGEALSNSYDVEVVNVSQSGANTAVTKERFESNVLPWNPDIVIIALSLGNEGLAHCPPNERRAAQFRFEQGLLDLLRMVVKAGAAPMLGGVYPNGDYIRETYDMLKETRHTMSTWGVPVFDWLDALDDGCGRWKTGLFFDHAHPNSEGHRKMFECINLSLFDPALRSHGVVDDLIRRRSSLTLEEFDRMERKTSHSDLDVQSAAIEDSKRTKCMPVFSDGKGFSITMDLTTGMLSMRNKTMHDYEVNGGWKDLVGAFLSHGLQYGIYVEHVVSDLARPKQQMLFMGGGRLLNEIAVPSGGDLIFAPSFPSLSAAA